MIDVLTPKERHEAEALRHNYAQDWGKIPDIYVILDRLAPLLDCPFCGTLPKVMEVGNVACSNVLCAIHHKSVDRARWQIRPR